MERWEKKSYKLEGEVEWKTEPGYKIFVADRVLRFDVPNDWTAIPGTDSFVFHDLPPPDDNCRLESSILHLPPGLDWSGLRLTDVLRGLLELDRRGVISRGEIVQEQRPNFELVWAETCFMDPIEHRPARTRTCVARGSDVQPVITMDFWDSDAAWCTPVWDVVLRSLQVGTIVKDPSRRDPG